MGGLHSHRRSNTVPIERRLPWRELRAVSRRQGTRKPPIYSVHRWWARRPPELYRAILTHLVPPNAHGSGRILAGKVVLDPFMGGGTTLVEAQALGADVVGFDTEALACRITALELSSAPPVEVWEEIERALQAVERRLRPYYGASRGWETLHLFWVDVVVCGRCRRRFDAHPQALLARDERKKLAVAFCRYCSRLYEMRGRPMTVACSCGGISRFSDTNANRAKYHCPFCGHDEPIQNYIRRRGARPPARHLVAKEEIHLATRARRFRPVSQEDMKGFERARRQFDRYEADLPIPGARVVTRPGDSRPRSYGFRRYRDMFNARQLLHHGNILKAFLALTEPARSIALLAFSESLETNCMFCPYSTDWRRLAAILSIHGYMYVSRPVELNPWLDGVGRGTVRNCVRRIRRALESKQQNGRSNQVRVHIGSLDALAEDDIRADYVVTDPPYFDNLDYSYLAKFHSVWLAGTPGLHAIPRVGGTPIRVRPYGGRAVEWREFYSRLRDIFAACRKRLRRNGLVVFTFAHRKPEAWRAIGRAISVSGFCVTAIYGVETEGRNGFHGAEGNLRWNAIFVCRRASGRPRRLRSGELVQAMNAKGLSLADRANLRMALEAVRRRAGKSKARG